MATFDEIMKKSGITPASTATVTTPTAETTITEDIIAEVETSAAPVEVDAVEVEVEVDAVEVEPAAEVGATSLDELVAEPTTSSDRYPITIAELHPDLMEFPQLPYVWVLNDNGLTIFRVDKTGALKKFEPRSVKFRWIAPAILEKFGCTVTAVTLAERGQVIIAAVNPQGDKLTVIDDFTSQTQGKYVRYLGDGRVLAGTFKHNQTAITRVLDILLTESTLGQ